MERSEAFDRARPQFFEQFHGKIMGKCDYIDFNLTFSGPTEIKSERFTFTVQELLGSEVDNYSSYFIKLGFPDAPDKTVCRKIYDSIVMKTQDQKTNAPPMPSGDTPMGNSSNGAPPPEELKRRLNPQSSSRSIFDRKFVDGDKMWEAIRDVSIGSRQPPEEGDGGTEV